MSRRLRLSDPVRLDATPAQCVVLGCFGPVPVGAVCGKHARALYDALQASQRLEQDDDQRGQGTVNARHGAVDDRDAALTTRQEPCTGMYDGVSAGASE